MNKKTNLGLKIICLNRKASFNYFFEDLFEAGIVLKGSEINNSNRYSLHVLLKKNYIEPKYLGILKDSKKKIIEKINKCINKFHVIISTGGASVGEEDHLISVLKDQGQIFFWKTAIKPGRPLAIGKIKKTIFICLPVFVLMSFFFIFNSL